MLNRRHFIATTVIAASCPKLGESQSPAIDSIWDDQAILPQPFDKEPFRAIKVPQWLRNTLGVGYTLSVMSSEQRDRAAKAGVTISELGFVDPYYAYYNSKLLKRHSPNVSHEQTLKQVEEYQRLGVRILGVYPPTLQGEVYALHPDWRLISTDTREIPQVNLTQNPIGGMLCPLGPYGDFFIEVLAEILETFPAVDAFSFDGLHYGGACYCEHCRNNYRREMGEELPPRDIANLAFRRYQHWADRRMENLIVRIQTRLKGIKPEVALVTWTTNAGRFGHFLDVPRNMPARMNLLLDAPDMEFWLDETNRGASVVPAFGLATMWAYSNHRTAFAEPYLMSRGNPYGKDSFPAHEIERRMMLAVTHGVLPSLAVIQPEHLQSAAYHCLAEVRRRGPWITHKQPEPWGALVMSDNTRCFYTRGDVEQRYMASVFGAFRAGLETHLPITVIADWNLTSEDLAKYKVLVLANTASLDDTQVEAIRNFVKQGGGLVATLDAGLCDAFGEPRSQHGLAELLGIEHLGPAVANAPVEELDINFTRTLPADYWTKRQGVWDFVPVAGTFLAESLYALIGNGSVTFKGPAIRVRPNAAQPLGYLQPRAGAKGEAVPAILTHQYGAGRVVLFAAGMDAANYLTPYPYYREALRAAIEHVASAPPPVRVKAPMCVHAVVTRQTRDGERLVIHLYNDVNTTAFHGLPADDVPLREEVIPIHDIGITLDGYNIRRCHVEPEGIELTITLEGNLQRVTIPRLDIHTLVVAEL